MIKQLKISIDNPCSESWAKMTPTEQGRHCQLCKKEVVDFTHMTDREIINHFKQYNNLCGRFNQNQLDRNLQLSSPPSPIKKWAIASILTASLLNMQGNVAKAKSTKQANHQTIRQSTPIVKKLSPTSLADVWEIQGKVVDNEKNTPIPHVTVLIKGTEQGTVSDTEGNFTIYISKDIEAVTLIFAYRGYIEQSHAVQKDYRLPLHIKLKSDHLILQAISGTLGMPSIQSEYYKKFSPKWFWYKIKRFPKWISKPFRKKTHE